MTLNKTAVYVVFLWLCIFAAFSNSFTVDFQFDDTHTVQSNIYVRTLSNIPLFFVDAKTFSYRPENSGYRPMSTLAMALGFALSNTATWGYHLIKLIEHALVATMVFFLALRLLPESAPWSRFHLAWFAGLIFGVHRANTETVDYITAVSSLQAAMFYLLAFLLYLKWRDSRKIGFFLISLVTYLAGLMSKEEAVTLPAMIFVYEWVFSGQTLRDGFWKWFKICIPYGLVATFFIFLRITLQPAEADLSRGNISTWIYFITQIRSWLYYWKLFFWPLTLNADNLGFDFSKGLDDERIWFSLFVHLAIAFWAWRMSARYRWVPFLVAWMYITILPASSFFPLVEAVTEHRMYIPYMGLSILSVWGFAQASQRFFKKKKEKYKIFVPTTLGILAFLLGLGAWQRTQVWQTSTSLWEDVFAKNPASPRAMNVLGVSYLNNEQVTKAVTILEQCHRLAPNYLPCIVHIGLGYSKLKRFDEGLTILKRGHALDPGYPHVNYHLGVYYKEYFADYEAARRHFRWVLEKTSGRMFHAALKIAEMDFEEGKFEDGFRMVNSVLGIDRTNAEAWEVYAKGNLAAGKLPLAEEVFQKLLTTSPGVARYHLNLANVAERRRDFGTAKAFYEQAIAIDEKTIQAWQGLARIAGQLGDASLKKQALEKISNLKGSGNFLFMPSMFLVGEKPRQIKPT